MAVGELAPNPDLPLNTLGGAVGIRIMIGPSRGRPRARRPMVQAATCAARISLHISFAAALFYSMSCDNAKSQTRRNAEVWGSIAHQPTHAEVKQAEISAQIRPSRADILEENAELQKFRKILLSHARPSWPDGTERKLNGGVPDPAGAHTGGPAALAAAALN